MSAPAKQGASRWGSFLQQAVAGIEQNLDNILSGDDVPQTHNKLAASVAAPKEAGMLSVIMMRRTRLTRPHSSNTPEILDSCGKQQTTGKTCKSGRREGCSTEEWYTDTFDVESSLESWDTIYTERKPAPEH